MLTSFVCNNKLYNLHILRLHVRDLHHVSLTLHVSILDISTQFNRLCSGRDGQCHEIQRVHYVDSQIEEVVPRGGDCPRADGGARWFVAAGDELGLGRGSQGSTAALKLTVTSTVPQWTFALVSGSVNGEIKYTDIGNLSLKIEIVKQDLPNAK